MKKYLHYILLVCVMGHLGAVGNEQNSWDSFEPYFIELPPELQKIIIDYVKVPCQEDFEDGDGWLQSRLERTRGGNSKATKYDLLRIDGTTISFFAQLDATSGKPSHILRQSDIPKLHDNAVIFSDESVELSFLTFSPHASKLLMRSYTELWKLFDREQRQEIQLNFSSQWPEKEYIRGAAISEDENKIGLCYIEPSQPSESEPGDLEDRWIIGIFDTKSGERIQYHPLFGLRLMDCSVISFTFNPSGSKIGLYYSLDTRMFKTKKEKVIIPL